MTKFLFIIAAPDAPTHEIFKRFQGWEGNFQAGIGYLISTLRERFGEDAIEFKVIKDNFQEQIRSFMPDIVGISSTTTGYNRAIEAAQIAKKCGLPVICGGVHISLLPTSLTEDMDVGVIGEGEETICELFAIFKNQNRLDKKELKKIKGLVFRDEAGQLCLTPPRELIASLDKIPPLARDVFTVESSFVPMFSSRGCPYKCRYCSSSHFWQGFRLFSAEYVVNEMKHLANKYGVENFGFLDDLFPTSEERIKKMIELLKKEGLLGRIKVVFIATRADLITDKMVKLLKELGVKTISMGLDSGCERTLQYLKNKTVTLQDNIRAVQVIKKYKIRIRANFIIGSPEETKEDILKTLKFIKKFRLDWPTLSILTPFPGTLVWDYAKSKNLITETTIWDNLLCVTMLFDKNDESYKSAVVLSEKLTREELYNLFQLFIKEIERQKRRQDIKQVIKGGMVHPWRIPKFLRGKLLIDNVVDLIF